MLPSAMALPAMVIVGFVPVLIGVSDTMVSSMILPATARVVSLALLDLILTGSKTGAVLS